jgi:uncharacterized membrane protein YedE/YeeE
VCLLGGAVIAIGCEPANGCGKGTYARLNWSASLVPEPATWAMLSGGLMLAGAAARRRRR